MHLRTFIAWTDDVFVQRALFEDLDLVGISDVILLFDQSEERKSKEK